MTQRTCSFCQVSKRTEVNPIITGPFRVRICGTCITRYAQQFGLSDSEDVRGTQASTSTPKDIKHYLDQHIIEQENAKKSVICSDL